MSRRYLEEGYDKFAVCAATSAITPWDPIRTLAYLYVPTDFYIDGLIPGTVVPPFNIVIRNLA